MDIQEVVVKKDLIERLREISACDPGCQGRCRECPNDVIEEAIAEIKRLRCDEE
jgi:hypothetical protein